jgi:hypothetical protein
VSLRVKQGSIFYLFLSKDNFKIQEIIESRNKGSIEDFKLMYNDIKIKKNTKKIMSKSFRQAPLGRQEIRFYKLKKIIKVKEYFLNAIPRKVFQAKCKKKID